MKRILVTGCAGFIGFHISKKLCEMEYLVVGIDNLNEYYDIALKYGRLEELKAIKSFHFAQMDLRDTGDLHELFGKYKFDLVLNLAAQAGVRYSFVNPQAYIESNITGFNNIISLAKEYNVAHFIYASSSSVYGKNTKVPFSESDDMEGQVSLYAQTKRANELEALRYSQTCGLCTTGLRFFTVYGPWGRPDMAPMLFMEAIANNQEIEVYNNGDLWRDFTYIDDLVNVVIKIIETDPDSAHPYQIYNIGNSSPVYLRDFISTMEEVIGKQAKQVMKPMQQGDVYKTYADTTLILNKFGIRPSTPIRTGIERLWEWYRKKYLLEE
ncbi:MAG: NAD-dependent epimerase/dehydratase family protein [Bacteroidales bacterium]|nr:NAD-dependent epimerase/dehydratase family protein [Bacteroidales bacterium]MDD3200928.1 NAD-dependent epimerase/dehydratase family protein [Bacteroidales bacterium]